MKATFLIIGTALAAWGQAPSPKLTCNDTRYFLNGLVPYCEMREVTVPYSGTLTADAGANGSIDVQSWDGPEILVRAQVVTAAETAGLAEDLAAQVKIAVSSGQALGSGPASNQHQAWTLNLEIYLPRDAGLSLTTLNGSVTVSGVAGPIQFSTINGTVSLGGVTGNVTGRIVNGRLLIAADHWQGEAIDVKTVNGSIEVDLPHDVSAHVELSVVLGTIVTNFSVPYWGGPGFGRRISFDAGSGRASVRAAVVNGTIKLKRLD